MKKSVLIPYERYQQLLQNNSPPTTAQIQTTEPEQLESSEQILNESTTARRLDPSVLIACLPKRNRSKAQQLIGYIEKHPILDWNQEGNLAVEQSLVPYSHIVDLLHDALNPTRHEPVGYEAFYKHLKHVPRSLINNPRRKSHLGSGQLPPPGIPVTEPKPLNVWKTSWKSL